MKLEAVGEFGQFLSKSVPAPRLMGWESEYFLRCLGARGRYVLKMNFLARNAVDRLGRPGKLLGLPFFAAERVDQCTRIEVRKMVRADCEC